MPRSESVKRRKVVFEVASGRDGSEVASYLKVLMVSWEFGRRYWWETTLAARTLIRTSLRLT